MSGTENMDDRGPREVRHRDRVRELDGEDRCGFTLLNAAVVLGIVIGFVLWLCVTFLGLAGLWGGIGPGGLLAAHPESLAASMGTTLSRALVAVGIIAALLGLKRAAVNISQSLQIMVVVASIGMILTADLTAFGEWIILSGLRHV